MSPFEEEEKEKEEGTVSDDALGEVLEEEPEDDEIDPLDVPSEDGDPKSWDL